MAVRTFKEWRQGSSGSADPATMEYNSENAQVYENGTLGPRPGWKDFAISTGGRVSDPSADTPMALQWYRDTDDAEGLLIGFSDASSSNDFTYDIVPLATGTMASGAVVDAEHGYTAKFQPPEWDDGTHWSTWNDGFSLTALGPYLAVAGSGTPGTFAASGVPPIRVQSTVYRDRTYAYSINSVPGRIYYSDAADYTTFQTASFFDVNAASASENGAVTGMWAVKNALMIARKDNRWMVLTGSSPENGTLRELGRDMVPDYNSAVVLDNQLFFLNPTGKGVCVATPSFVETTALEYLSPTAYPSSTQIRPNTAFQPQEAISDETSRTFFMPGRNNSDDTTIVAVERVNDVFNLSRWLHNTAAVQDVFFTAGRPGEMYALVDQGTTWQIYSRNVTLNRPANSGDGLSVALTNDNGVSAGTEVIVDLGETVAGEGDIVRPVKVVIDLDYWKGGNYSAPELKIDATVLGTESTVPEDSITSQTVTTSGWNDTSGNLPYKRRVAVALPATQFGTRFRIRVTYDNLALDTVQVYYDEQDDPR
jgi:hypothetical protein